MHSSPEYSIVIPVYKSGKVLVELLSQISDVFHLNKLGSYEIIFVNDSPYCDNTRKYLAECKELNSNVKVITLSRNFGQQAATICGIEYSCGAYIITMDDDLQHSPNDIPKLINQKKHDIVIANLQGKKHSLLKRLFSRVKNYFDHIILGKPRSVKMSSFRLINRMVADNIVRIKTPYPFIPALLFKVSLDVANPKVRHHSRKEGVSGYSFSLMLKLFSNLIINNSSYLLTMIGRLGALSLVLSIIFSIFLVYGKMSGSITFSGWTSIMALMSMFGGAILFSLGVIGEYLIRIIHSSESKPAYIVKDES